MAGAAPGTTFGVDFICCQTKGCGKSSLSFSSQTNGFKRVKPAKRALGAAKLEAVASQVVPFLVPNFCCQTSGCGKPSLFVSTGPKLPDAPSKPCKPLKLPKRATAALGAAKLEAVASQVVPFLVQN